jgi:hypothetical protein
VGLLRWAVTLMNPDGNYIIGTKLLECKSNIRLELKRLQSDPLERLLPFIRKDSITILSDDHSRYEDAYSLYRHVD